MSLFDAIKILSISSITELGTMNAYKMLILLLVMLLGKSCIVEANETSTKVDDINDERPGFEDDNDSGSSFFHKFAT